MFSAKHRYFIVFHSFHEFSTGKTPGNGGKPVFLWKRGTCRGAGPWLRLYLVYKRFIFAPSIAGCERWKNKSFQHHCGKRCGKSLAGEQETAGSPSKPFRPALCAATAPLLALRATSPVSGESVLSGEAFCARFARIKAKKQLPAQEQLLFSTLLFKTRSYRRRNRHRRGCAR